MRKRIKRTFGDISGSQQIEFLADIKGPSGNIFLLKQFLNRGFSVDYHDWL